MALVNRLIARLRPNRDETSVIAQAIRKSNTVGLAAFQSATVLRIAQEQQATQITGNPNGSDRAERITEGISPSVLKHSLVKQNINLDILNNTSGSSDSTNSFQSAVSCVCIAKPCALSCFSSAECRLRQSLDGLHSVAFPLKLTAGGPNYQTRVFPGIFHDSPRSSVVITEGLVANAPTKIARRVIAKVGHASHSRTHPPVAVQESFISREILIIGSNYGPQSVGAPIINSYGSLKGAKWDEATLEQTFQRRKYKVKSMVNDDFDRSAALSAMSSFLRTAKPGDVRIVVYTGHADRFFHEDRPSIVPPACASPEQAISAQCWEDTVRRNSTPGAIVLSVFACCYAGGFMQQKSSLLNMDEGIFFSHWTKGRHEAPTFLTLSSSTALGPSYESMGHQSDGVGDHFLHAINVAVRSRQVNGWEDFARALEFHFMEARTSGFLGDAENNLHEELISYPQEPVLTASGLPAFNVVFPRIPPTPHESM